MEYHAVVVSALGELCKVLAGLEKNKIQAFDEMADDGRPETYPRCMVPVEFQLDVT